MSVPLTIVWLRQDLRLDDNAALSHAAGRGLVLPLFIDTTAHQYRWIPGEAARWWLGRSLRSLDRSLRALNSRLVVGAGDAVTVLLEVARESGADAVVWNRRYEPSASRHDERVQAALGEAGLRASSFGGRLLREPWEVRTKTGGCYKVFTPYWRAVRALPVSEPLEAPKVLRRPAKWPRSVPIDELPATSVSRATAKRLIALWRPGESSALARAASLDTAFATGYPVHRDFPAEEATSGLSPHLHLGEISPRRLFAILRGIADRKTDERFRDGIDAIVRQLVWRDFAYHLLYNFPRTPDEPLRAQFAQVAWREDRDGLAAWTRGETGFPLVDAGMRQLAQTGWMHNRVRMITASFLTKDLLIHWREGARVYWERLVDADLANNTFGWQWAAGCGADAAPYFRIFNPTTQAARFDPGGTYVRKWVPELAALPTKYLHAPWTAPADVLEKSGVVLGCDYSRPIVDHSFARSRALKAFEVLKTKKHADSRPTGAKRP